MAVAIAWLPGPAGTRRRVAKPSVEEPDAAEPARPDLWGARVSNDPGLPDLFYPLPTLAGSAVRLSNRNAQHPDTNAATESNAQRPPQNQYGNHSTSAMFATSEGCLPLPVVATSKAPPVFLDTD